MLLSRDFPYPNAWSEVVRHLSPDPTSTNGGFGHAVAIHDAIAVVGAPRLNTVGAAYVYDRYAGNGWQQVAVLSPAAPGHAREFGYAVACWGDVVLVGMPSRGASEGFVAVFERSTGFGFARHLTPFGSVADDHFGLSLAMRDGHVVVGQPGYQSNKGLVQFFARHTPTDVVVRHLR